MRTLLLLMVAAITLFVMAGWVRNLVLGYRKSPRVFRYHALQAVLWMSAVLSLSACLATWRRLSGEQPNIHPVLNLLLGTVYLVVLLGSFVVLGFFMYREDSRKGIIKRRLALYDRFMGGSVGE